MTFPPVKNSHSQLMEDHNVRDVVSQLRDMKVSKPLVIEADGDEYHDDYEDTILVMSPNKKWTLFRGLMKSDDVWLVTYDAKLITPV